MKFLVSSARIGLIILLGAIQPLQAWAEVDDAFKFFQEEAQVVTASRRQQQINTVPMAVDVITQEEIRTSGATNLWDLLRFRVGMDVMNARSINGNRALVSVRGFPQDVVGGNMQLLVDGRSVVDPTVSGIFWQQLPVQIQDIERIEIIRGPNSALYGSGAALGVINILTKKPEKPTQGSVSAYGGNRGQIMAAGALESAISPVAFRASYTFQEEDGFPLTDAAALDQGQSPGSQANDFLNSRKANIRTHWAPSEKSALEFFAGGSWDRSGITTSPRAQAVTESHFEMLKFAHAFTENSTLKVLGSRNSFIDNITPSPFLAESGDNHSGLIQYDGEILHHLRWWNERLNTTYGFNYRDIQVNSEYLFGPNTRQTESLWNAYFQQAIQLTSQLALSGAAAVERTTIGEDHTTPNYQVASIWSPWEVHAFRASYAVSHTVPGLLNASANDQIPPALVIQGNPTLKPQKTTSYEVGYLGTLLERHLQLNASLFYMVLKNIPESTQSVTFPPLLITLGFDNLNQAIARGAELELKYRFDGGHSAYANYTFEHITDWVGSQQGNAGDTETITRNTPTHRANFGGIARLGHGFTASTNIGYRDSTFISSFSNSMVAAIPAYWHVDARLAYALPFYKDAELFMACQNLAQKTHVEYADSTTVPRTYQGGINIKFGGGK
jgi:iron complex outermembrane recepter protein